MSMSIKQFSFIRRHILAAGQVQGVGFRPFIYKLAIQNDLCGFVCNTSEGVCIEIQGQENNVQAFLEAMPKSLPPLAELTSLSVHEIPPVTHEKAFSIVQSAGNGGHKVLISPDMSLCQQCEQDMEDINNIRHAYAFTNCTNCGPRYTITKSIPYDRATTSMHCFPLCTLCQNEYDNPLNRRFHAQPNACPLCGPCVWSVPAAYVHEAKKTSLADNISGQAALRHVAQALLKGSIIAMKGLGGFHLACSALDENAIMRLRQRKQRPHKPLAVMVEDMATARLLAHISPQEESLLSGVQKPIVLCQRKDTLPDILAPDTDTIGLVLAYTPLHKALFMHLRQITHTPLALVMTSGNAAGEPICLGNREALSRLSSMVDMFLLHNRDILVRNDDSVCAVFAKETTSENPQTHTIFLRRARGYVPKAISLVKEAQKKTFASVLGMGAQLKNTVCLSRGDTAFVSQHIGDMHSVHTLAFQREVVTYLQMLLQVRPDAVVHDLHPDFLSTHAAKEYAAQWNVPCYALQHHYAHAYAVLAEHMSQEPCLALCLDGTGYGDDGTIWGGELLYIHGKQKQRMGRLSPFALMGGEQAIKEPWRLALTLAQGTELEEELSQQQPQGAMLLELLNKKFPAPMTSSAGRLFDAVSAGLSLCQHISYEGQAAIVLEQAQKHVPHTKLPHSPHLISFKDGLWEISSTELFKLSLQLAQKKGISAAAHAFHAHFSSAFLHITQCAATTMGVQNVLLCGGVLQNATIYALLTEGLQKAGFKVLLPKNMPSNDGAISLGQVYYGLIQSSD